MDYNWLNPKAEARLIGDQGLIGDKGWGSFACETIAAGETVAAFGGWVMPGVALETLSADRQHRSIQVDADLYLVSGDTPEPGDMINHSCEPNCG